LSTQTIVQTVNIGTAGVMVSFTNSIDNLIQVSAGTISVINVPQNMNVLATNTTISSNGF